MVCQLRKGSNNMTVATKLPRTFRDVIVNPTAETMLSLFACAGIEKNSAVYVSTPITTGELLISWHEGKGSKAARNALDSNELRSEVIERNLATVGPLIQRVRMRFDQSTVIEPVSMKDVPGWQQSDYHAFWCAFVERYANTVVFNKGWHLSNGCAAEFATAVLAGHRILDHNLETLSILRALGLIEKAIERLNGTGLDASVLREAQTAVRQHYSETHDRTQG